MSVKKKAKVNVQITAPEVRLIDADGEQAGVVSLQVALDAAKTASLDLVEISPNAAPPVCKIMDFGKYKFEQSKKNADSKKKQKKVHLKEIKFRPGTEIGDYNVKLKKIVDFIEKGDKVKVTIRFRGREMMHQDLGADLMTRLQGDVEEIATIEQVPKLEGRQMIMMLGPKKK